MWQVAARNAAFRWIWRVQDDDTASGHQLNFGALANY
jgi:hypothetical protein